MSEDTVMHELLSLYQGLFQQHENPSVLLVADESFDTNLIPSLQQNIAQLQVISNRYDVAEQCKAHGLPCVFNDYDFSALNHTQYDYCLFRIPKERAVCHHVFNQSKTFLASSGQLLIGGKKNEGIKNYQQALVKNIGFKGILKKQGNNYIGAFSRPTEYSTLLDDKNYTALRTITLKHCGISIHTKPGLFGWNKEDQGSAMLMDWLAHTINDTMHYSKQSFSSVLDLGCGYGYLSVRLLQMKHAAPLAALDTLYATDNNAAAIRACELNLQQANSDKALNLHVEADNCGESIRESVDLVLCNPPFHQGFENSRALTQRFLSTTKRFLKKGGVALFVVNQFIPLEQLAKQHFSKVTLVHADRSFKLIQLKH